MTPPSNPIAPPGARGFGAKSERARRLGRLALARASFALAAAAFAGAITAAFVLLAFVGPLLGIAGISFLVGLFSMMVPSGIEGDAIYPGWLPLRALIDASDLGARSAKDVTTAEIVKQRLQGFTEYTTLWVSFAPSGAAVFGGNTGLPEMDPEEMAAIQDPEMRAALKGVVDRRAEDIRVGIDWLSSHGVAIMPATPRAPRRRAKKWAKHSLVVGAVFSFGLPALFWLGATGAISASMVGGAAVPLLMLGPFPLYMSSSFRWTGAAASDEGLFRPKLSFRELFEPDSFGLVPAEAVESWETRRAGWLSKKNKWVLRVNVRGQAPIRVLDGQDPVGFKAVREWLTTHQVPPTTGR